MYISVFDLRCLEMCTSTFVIQTPILVSIFIGFSLSKVNRLIKDSNILF